MMRLTLYAKPGCSLCDDLKEIVQAMQAEFQFELVECNILDNPEHFSAFRYLIPILDIDGRSLLYPPHSRHSVHSALLAAQKADASHG